MVARAWMALCAACLACAGAPAARPGGAVASAAAPPAHSQYPLRATPPSLQGAASRADQAITRFQQRVTREFMVEVARHGPAASVGALRGADQPIAAEVQAETGCEVGRTSHKLRNPANAAPDWVKPLLGNGKARPAAELEPVVVDLGDRVGVVRPISVYANCLDCHGSATRVPSRVRSALSAAYPSDRALDYAEGDLRGFYWAEARKERVR